MFPIPIGSVLSYTGGHNNNNIIILNDIYLSTMLYVVKEFMIYEARNFFPSQNHLFFWRNASLYIAPIIRTVKQLNKQMK